MKANQLLQSFRLRESLGQGLESALAWRALKDWIEETGQEPDWKDENERRKFIMEESENENTF